MKPRTIDLAILGGGCAGLSLARELASASESGRDIPGVLILEASPGCSSSKTWCYWEENWQAEQSRAPHHWPSWSFSSGKEVHRHESGNWRYTCLPAKAFFQDALETIERCPLVDLLEGWSVDRVDCLPEGLLVHAGKEQFLCRHLVDTRPPRREDQLASRLFQGFLGFEVRAKDHTADPGTVGLMESMQSDELGFRFDYILPLESDRLLVEATRFSTEAVSKDQLLDDLRGSLSRLIPSGEFELLREEFGLIPMGMPDLPQPTDSRWVNAGTRGGAVRPASGYAFAGIQEWAAACAQHILEHDKPIPHPGRPCLLKAMDHLFLDVLAAEPDLAPELFLSMARHLNPDTFARFMTGSCGPGELIHVIGSLPFKPFLLGLVRELDLPLNTRPIGKVTS